MEPSKGAVTVSEYSTHSSIMKINKALREHGFLLTDVNLENMPEYTFRHNNQGAEVKVTERRDLYRSLGTDIICCNIEYKGPTELAKALSLSIL